MGQRIDHSTIPSAQPAGSHQQVMSPTLGQGYGTNPLHPSSPLGGDGLQHSGSMPPRESGHSGAVDLNLIRLREIARFRGSATNVDRQ